MEVMAKKSKPPPAVASGARPRGRPPKPGGRIPQAEVQRAYRARLAAAGKVVRIVDAALLGPATAGEALGPTPDFDPARDGIYERVIFEKMREDLRHALLKLELKEEDVVRLEQRNAYLERELKLLERHHQQPEGAGHPQAAAGGEEADQAVIAQLPGPSGRPAQAACGL